MDSQALLAHILSQTKQNVEFLIAQKQIAPNDGEDILAKLSPIQNQPPHEPSVVALAQHTQNLSISAPDPRMGSSPAHSSSPYSSPAHPTTLFQARALWNYNEHGQDPNDLSFRAGDVVDITAQTNTDWWTGSHRGKQGLFPVSYVERLPPSASSGFAPPTAPAPYGSLLSHAGPEKVPVHSPAPSAPYPPYQPAGGYQPPPPGGAYNPYGGPAQPQSPPSNTAVANPEQPPKKSKFGGKFGSTLAHSAVGGVGFGAGSAVGSGLINSIF